MKKLILSIVFVAMAAAGGTYWYIYHKVKTMVDTSLEQLRPFGIIITYQHIKIPLDGSVVFDDLTFSGITDRKFNIRSADLRLPDLMSLLKFEDALKARQLPPSLKLRINRIGMDVDFIAATIGAVQLAPGNDRVQASGCDDMQAISYEFYPKLGYQNYDVSIGLGLTHNPDLKTLTVVVDIIGHDDKSATVSFTVPNMSGLPGTQQPISAGLNNVTFTKFSITLQDLGFNKRLRQFCSGKSGVAETEYADYRVKLMREYLVRGKIQLSDAIYAAYKESQADGAKIKFDFNPPNPSGIKNLDMYKPGDWPAVLGMIVYVNDKKIDDLAMNWDKEQAMQYLLNAPVAAAATPESPSPQTEKTESTTVMANKVVPETESATDAAAKIVPKTETAPKVSGWRKIAPEDLAQHIGKAVNLVTSEGRVREGFIMQVKDQTAFISTKASGGGLSFDVALSDINTVQIYDMY